MRLIYFLIGNSLGKLVAQTTLVKILYTELSFFFIFIFPLLMKKNYFTNEKNFQDAILPSARAKMFFVLLVGETVYL